MTVGLDLIALSVCTILSSSTLAYNDSQSTQNPRNYYQFWLTLSSGPGIPQRRVRGAFSHSLDAFTQRHS